MSDRAHWLGVWRRNRAAAIDAYMQNRPRLNLDMKVRAKDARRLALHYSRLVRMLEGA